MTALSLEHVSHAFGDILAVDDFSLSVEPGELVCLVGPSGCGKTTVLRIAAGLEELQEGRVGIAGKLAADPTKGVNVAPDRRGVGLVFQDYALFPHLTVRENVAFGLRRLAAGKRRKLADRVLARIGMAESAEAYPHTLSGGQQQRVALARALAPGPKLVLLDEPFSGLDSRLRDQIRDETLHVLKDSGAATLMVTHDAEEALFMADRIAVMRAGRIVQVGPPVDIYFHPVDTFVASFVGEVNRVPGVVEKGRVVTPFGAVAAKGFADKTRVEVLIRPEGFRISPVADEAVEPDSAAKVITSRMLGRSSLIHLCVGDFNGAHLHLHSRMPGRVLPQEDDIVAVELDQSQVFVFPVEQTGQK